MAQGTRRGLALALRNVALTHLEEADPVAAEDHLLAALAISEELGDRFGIAAAHVALGWCDGQRGRAAEAARHLRDGLVGFTALGQRAALLDILELRADVAVRAGRAEDAAWFVGATEGLRAAHDMRANRTTTERSERIVRSAAAELGEEASAAHRGTGAAATLDAAEERVRSVLAALGAARG